MCCFDPYHQTVGELQLRSLAAAAVPNSPAAAELQQLLLLQQWWLLVLLLVSLVILAAATFLVRQNMTLPVGLKNLKQVLFQSQIHQKSHLSR